jgi:1-hydroxycarotenoid 3,4-desaturase
MARVLVLGAGVGGLSLAARLAARGDDVVVLEKEATVGGKMRALDVGGAGIDAGPTVLTMPWVFDELFAEAGGDFRRDVPIAALDVLARHQFADGSVLDLFADVERSADAIAAFAGAREADGYRRFTAYGRRILETVREPFLLSPLPTARDLLSLGTAAKIRAFATIDGTRTLAKAVASFFADERLRMLFGRYATYAGSSPYLAPATLNVIAAVEQEGVYVVRGGMTALSGALRLLAERNGAEVRTSACVDEIVVENGRAVGVRLAGGELLRAGAIVTNGDAAGLGRLVPALATRRPFPEEDRSLSAVVVTMRARAAGFPLAHHTVFFSSSYPREFSELFDERRVPNDPTLYLCAQDRGPFGGDTDGGERLLMLANAPATGDRPGSYPDEDTPPWLERTITNLRTRGLQLDVSAARTTTPRSFAALFPSTGGALYGPASHGMTSAFARPAARTKIPGLYAVGGSVHPGAGVPMAALSSRLAARAIAEDLASTRTSRAAATPGGTSTPRAAAVGTRLPRSPSSGRSSRPGTRTRSTPASGPTRGRTWRSTSRCIGSTAAGASGSWPSTTAARRRARRANSTSETACSRGVTTGSSSRSTSARRPFRAPCRSASPGRSACGARRRRRPSRSCSMPRGDTDGGRSRRARWWRCRFRHSA